MATYFVDDGGDNSDGSTWAKAYTSIQALDTAVTIASDDIIYIGADSNCTDAAGALTITGPASGLPARIISSTVGAGTTVAYSKGTGDQILATGGASDIFFDGSFALYGIRIKAGRWIGFRADNNEAFYTEDCTLVPGSTQSILLSQNDACSRHIHKNLTIDLSNDAGASANAPLSINTADTVIEIEGLTFTIGTALRTGSIIATGSQGIVFKLSGADVTGFTNATLCELVTLGANQTSWELSNIRTAATWGASTGTPGPGVRMMLTNAGPIDSPEMLFYQDYFGTCEAPPGDAPAGSGLGSIYRTGGATVEDTATAWLITTTATCGEGAPFHTPWIYGTTTNGTKTFDLYITHDADTTYDADFTDAQVWLEVEYLKDADEAQWFLASDHRTITATAAAQTDDTTSTWNGTGPSFTYKQKLSCASVAVGESGQYRARVAVGAASIGSAHYFYIDPKVTVT